MSVSDHNITNHTSDGNRQSERVPLRERRKQSQGIGVMAAFSENKSMLVLFCVIVAALAVILVSILVLKVPVVPVCIIVVLEAALAVCLHDVPVWLHGLVIIAQVAAGVFCSSTVFILLCAVLYLLGMLTLRFIRD